jgi:hypothetical protein
MKKFLIFSLMAVFPLVGCDRDSDTREAASEAAEESREAREEALEESREAGSAIERTSEDIAARVPDDDRLDPTTKDHEEFVGKVTRFSVGNTLSIETASGDNQSFDLDETGTKVNMPASIKEGATVRVTVHRSGNQKTIDVAAAQ